ncbi:MAG: acylneuraminate cytidylyltransferase family protein [Nitrososphaeraceae archaeon]
MNRSKYGDVLALIPARGGSKSIPRKNIIPILGKPMIAWTIGHAIASKHINRVIVTTDDEEIAEIARKYGAEVPFLRSAEISGDFSLDIEFHQQALNWLKTNEDYTPEMVVNLRPTSPLRKPAIIDHAIETFSAHPEADSLRSVHLTSKTPFKMWLIGDDGYMKPVARNVHMHEPYNQPRQKLPLVYWQDGYIDITRPSVIFEKNSTTGDIILPFIIEEPVMDIDYFDSLKSLEDQLLKQKKYQRSLSKSKEIRYPS